MKRVKTVKHVDGVRPLLLAGLVLASLNAQASIGDYQSGGRIGIGNGGSIEIRSGGSIEIRSPGVGIEPSFNNGHTPYASSSVSGSMNYSVGAANGNFSESDASPDGSMVALELDRKGFGYRAGAVSESGVAKASAETLWSQTSGAGSSLASASSTWSDWFVMSGGTGLGTARFASQLDGVMVSARNGSAGYSLNIGYATGAYCDYGNTACGEADRSQTLFNQTSSLSGKGKSTLSQDIEGEFTFAYDKAFQLTATLNVNAANGGMAEFSLASLGSSLILPEGANLLNASGLYVQAVPEADTYAMMLAGLGLVGFAARRRAAV
ncbi:MAG: PEP-CTERM sorting domain-containing protein [Thiobacillus sp.]